MEKLKQSFSHWSILDYTWLAVANLVLLALSIYFGDSLLSIVSALTGATSVIFISKQMPGAYYFGAVNSVTYAIISYQNHIYGSAVLYACYYVPMQFIGLYLWTQAKKKSASNTVEAKTLSSTQRCFLGCMSILAILVLSTILTKLGGNVAIIDATTTVLSIIGVYLMTKQYIEQWYVWLIVNTVSTILWVISLSEGAGNFATLFMWVIYVLNSLFGLYSWKKKK